MAYRTILALLAGLLLLAACDDETDEPDDLGEPDDAELDDDALEEELGEQPDPVDLEDGLAAVIDEHEISDGDVDEETEELADTPQVAAQLEQGQLTEELLPSLALEQLIQLHVLEREAEALGVEVDQEDLDEVEEEVAEQAGGRDAFEEQLEEAGISREELDEELRLQALVDGLQEELDVDEDAAEEDEAMEGQPVDPGEQAVMQWLMEQLQDSDIAVDEEYGVWVAEQGALMPPEDAMPDQPPMGDPEDMEELEDMDPEELEELEEQLEEDMGG